MKYVNSAKLHEQEQAVSPVIATILMFAITVVLAGVLVVYMQSFQNVGGGTNVVASISAKPFSNNHDPETINGGGWTIEVVSVKSGTINVNDLIVNVKSSTGGVISSMTGASATLKDTSGAADYYLQSDDLPNCNYWLGPSSLSADCTGASGDEFSTIQNATIIFVDNDASATLTASDTLIVYKNTDGTGSNEVASGSSVEIKSSSNKIASTDLT